MKDSNRFNDTNVGVNLYSKWHSLYIIKVIQINGFGNVNDMSLICFPIISFFHFFKIN
jgi:hypothetical protein